MGEQSATTTTWDIVNLEETALISIHHKNVRRNPVTIMLVRSVTGFLASSSLRKEVVNSERDANSCMKEAILDLEAKGELVMVLMQVNKDQAMCLIQAACLLQDKTMFLVRDLAMFLVQDKVMLLVRDLATFLIQDKRRCLV